MISAFFLLVLFFYSGSLLSRFDSIESKGAGEVMVNVYSSDVEAGSAYLQWIDVSSPIQAIVFAPLRMFYFLYSPIPFDWRGMMDIIAFLLDSTIYIFLSFKIITNNIYYRHDRTLVLFVVISFLAATFLFAFGTIASGTAIRHRAKILSLLLICYGVAMKSKSCYSIQSEKNFK